jgi:hypothetical protein
MPKQIDEYFEQAIVRTNGNTFTTTGLGHKIKSATIAIQYSNATISSLDFNADVEPKVTPIVGIKIQKFITGW